MSMKEKKILLLGATGFVGRNLVREFEKAGLAPVKSSLSLGVDLRELSAVEWLLDSQTPDVIVNCAAHVGSLNYVTQQAADVVHDNTLMTLNLYRAIARHCPAVMVINPIANCGYPDAVATFREEEWWNGHLHRSVLSYGATRRHLWAVGECYSMQHGIRSIHLLVPNMYGPYDSTDPNKAHALNALVCKFVRANRTNDPVTVWGTGVAIREWLYAADFGRIVLEIIQKEGEIVGLAEPLNIGQNFGLSVKELVSLISAQFEKEVEVLWDCERPDGAPRKVMDDTRFKRVFPKFEFTELGHGLAATVEYYDEISS